MVVAEEVHMRWESEARYYTVLLHQDLLEDWVLKIAYGGRGNRLGALVHKAVATKEAGLAEIASIAGTRERHRYTVVRGVAQTVVSATQAEHPTNP